MNAILCLCSSSLHMLSTSRICNLLLENPEYPRRETAAATAAPSSILLESGDTQAEVGGFSGCIHSCFM